MVDDMDIVPVLREELREVKSDVTEIKKDLKELVAIKHKVIGGIRVIAIAISVCGFIFGSVTALVRDNHESLLKMQVANRDFIPNYCTK